MPEHRTLDALIVLGARLNAQGRPGRIGRMRLEHAIAVWQEQGGEAYVIITGGPTHGTHLTEARAMADYALAWTEDNWGAEMRDRLAGRLILEEESKNTLASARHTLPVVQDLNLASVALVSDGLHIRRARYLFRRHFHPHQIDLYSLPVPGVLRTYWQNRRYLWLTKMALREGAAWLKVLGRRALFWR
ncbi:MAG: YdcF family protein [Deltaproteobacteria bacterium]|nr:YdcF family protein [Deltaproteobacteria bacterium]